MLLRWIAPRRRGMLKLLLYVAAIVYCCLLTFALFNFKSRCRYEMPTEFADPVFLHSDSSRCRIDFDSLGLVKINARQVLSMHTVEQEVSGIQPGGKWSPTQCQAWQKIAIVIAYRDRYNHLILVLKRLHELLRRQLVDYRIFVVEQVGDGVFNKGRLYNTGVEQALKHDTFNCFIFHDVDLLPEHDGNIYYCDQHVRHLSSAVDEMRYHTMYYNLIGGVVSITRENFYRVNGYPNDYWGWGNEDDDFCARTEASGLMITRPPEYIGRYKMVPHTKRAHMGSNNGLFLTWRSRWPQNGLSSLATSGSKVVGQTEHKLYTNISVDVGLPPPAYQSQGNIPRESLLWFLNFFYP